MAELSFLQKMGKFCGNVESGIAEVQDALWHDAGTRPENYGPAMEILKTEVNAVKKLSSDLKLKLPELDKVADFRCSLNEIICGYKDDIRKAEDFMKKYGYKPPTDNSMLFREEKQSVEEPQIDIKPDIAKITIEEILMSPELSEFGKSITNCKESSTQCMPKVKAAREDIPIVFSAKRSQCHSVHRVRLEEHLRTIPPTPIVEDDFLTPFITSKNIRPKLIRESVPFDVNSADDYDMPVSCDQNMPPSVKAGRFVLRPTTECSGTVGSSIRNPACSAVKVPTTGRKESKYTPSVTRNTPIFATKPVAVETPESPVLSDVTVRFLKGENRPQITPESPVMSCVAKRIISHNTDNPQDVVADRPDLASQYDIENCDYFFLNTSQNTDDCIKSPVFSDAAVNFLKNHIS